MLPSWVIIVISCLIFIIFSIIKSLDLSSDTTIKTRAKAVFYTIFIEYKLFVKVAIQLVVLFVAFMIVMLFIRCLIELLKGSQGVVEGAKETVMFAAKLFLGFFTYPMTTVAHLVLIPVFVLFFTLIFTDTMYKPKNTEEQEEDSNRVNRTMNHFLFMLVLALFFTTTIYLFVCLLTDHVMPQTSESEDVMTQLQNDNKKPAGFLDGIMTNKNDEEPGLLSKFTSKFKKSDDIVNELAEEKKPGLLSKFTSKFKRSADSSDNQTQS